jgi:NADPH-dependent 2,4-dienoyl-CoA reductase/sulfur reductase-like enzyme
MTAPAEVVVVGASAAGLSTLIALRRRGYTGRLTILGAEAHLPYDRPPLSKQVLSGAWEPARARLRTAEALSALDATWLLGDAAVSLNTVTRTIRTASGRSLGADAIVLATGAAPRLLPGQQAVAGAHVVRTLDDVLALRADLSGHRRVVVVGDGVLGTEIAATTRQLGHDVTLVGPQPAPMFTQLGPQVSQLLAELHAGHGVLIRSGVGVNALVTEQSRVTGVRLDSGEVLPADVAVIALGAAPATGWLAGSPLIIDDGVVCDARCQAEDGIFAVGDVCRWYHESLQSSVRLENRTNATEQADVVAANILGARMSYTPVPYFWTDQFGVKVQVHGMPSPEADVELLDGNLTGGRFVLLHRRAGVRVAVLGWNMPKQTRLHRQLLDRVPPVPAPLPLS